MARRASTPSSGARSSRWTGSASRSTTSTSGVPRRSAHGDRRDLGREPARVDAVLREWPKIRARSTAGTRRSSGSSGRRQLADRPVQEPPGAGLRRRRRRPRRSCSRLRPESPEPGRVRLQVDILDAPIRAWRDRIRLNQSPASPCSGSSTSHTRRPRWRAPGARVAAGRPWRAIRRNARRPAGVAPPRHRPARGRSRDDWPAVSVRGAPPGRASTAARGPGRCPEGRPARRWPRRPRR